MARRQAWRGRRGRRSWPSSGTTTEGTKQGAAEGLGAGRTETEAGEVLAQGSGDAGHRNGPERWRNRRGRRRGRDLGALLLQAEAGKGGARAQGRDEAERGEGRGGAGALDAGGGRARWIGRSGALPGDASMRAMGIECGAEGGRGGDGIGQGMFGPVGLGLGGARLGHDANGPAWLLGCKAVGLAASLSLANPLSP